MAISQKEQQFKNDCCAMVLAMDSLGIICEGRECRNCPLIHPATSGCPISYLKQKLFTVVEILQTEEQKQVPMTPMEKYAEYCKSG